MFKIFLGQIVAGIFTVCSIAILVGILEVVSGILRKKFSQIRKLSSLKCLPIWMISGALIVGFMLVGVSWY